MPTLPPSSPQLSVTLPPDWDLARDLFILCGRGGGPVVEALKALGHERVMVIVGPGGADESLPEGVRAVSGRGEVFEAIHTQAGALPAQVQLLRTSDPWASVEQHRELARWVEEALSSRRLQKRTVETIGSEWLLHGLRNLPEIARRPSIAQLENAFQGRPAVLVSPGPSLSRNLHLLPQLQGRAVIVTGTHSLLALAKAGVSPDFVIACDAGDLHRHYAGLEAQPPRALCVEATSRPENFGLPAERVYPFVSSGNIDEWIYGCVQERASLASGGSVSCTALSLARWMGCGPIAFVGQDLSFPEGKYYAQESLDGDAQVELDDEGNFALVKPEGATGIGVRQADGRLRFNRSRPALNAPGYYGGTVATSESLNIFRAWFEAIAEDCPTPLWNCTEGGAYLEGMEHVPLQKAVDEWTREPLDVGAVLDRLPRGDVDQRRAAFARVARERIEALTTCGKLAQDCERLALRAKRDGRALEKLQAKEAKLSRALAPVRFLSLSVQADIEAAQEKARQARDLDENLAASVQLFRVVLEQARKLRTPLQQALTALEA